ncbi:hypothetical protein C7M84_007584 [Penaeus vannamei]|uniref:Uncharacterized protein n=1 Tax=Penaeus vannamei TaxID=6689 RepID=A0A423TC06_PENVA|nr:hypothetical protein C7M84_007584 [Penaeus vannamei]
MFENLFPSLPFFSAVSPPPSSPFRSLPSHPPPSLLFIAAGSLPSPLPRRLPWRLSLLPSSLLSNVSCRLPFLSFEALVPSSFFQLLVPVHSAFLYHPPSRSTNTPRSSILLGHHRTSTLRRLWHFHKAAQYNSSTAHPPHTNSILRTPNTSHRPLRPPNTTSMATRTTHDVHLRCTMPSTLSGPILTAAPLVRRTRHPQPDYLPDTRQLTLHLTSQHISLTPQSALVQHLTKCNPRRLVTLDDPLLSPHSAICTHSYRYLVLHYTQRIYIAGHHIPQPSERTTATSTATRQSHRSLARRSSHKPTANSETSVSPPYPQRTLQRLQHEAVIPLRPSSEPTVAQPQIRLPISTSKHPSPHPRPVHSTQPHNHLYHSLTDHQSATLLLFKHTPRAAYTNRHICCTQPAYTVRIMRHHIITLSKRETFNILTRHRTHTASSLHYQANGHSFRQTATTSSTNAYYTKLAVTLPIPCRFIPPRIDSLHAARCYIHHDRHRSLPSARPLCDSISTASHATDIDRSNEETFHPPHSHTLESILATRLYLTKPLHQPATPHYLSSRPHQPTTGAQNYHEPTTDAHTLALHHRALSYRSPSLYATPVVDHDATNVYRTHSREIPQLTMPPTSSLQPDQNSRAYVSLKLPAICNLQHLMEPLQTLVIITASAISQQFPLTIDQLLVAVQSYAQDAIPPLSTRRLYSIPVGSLDSAGTTHAHISPT